MAHQGYSALPQTNSAAPPPSSTSAQVDPSVVIEPYRPDVTPDWLPPPSNTQPFAPENPPQPLTEAVLDTRPFSHEDARECLDTYIGSTWFGKRGFARDLMITDISSSNTYVAELETFLESRKFVADYRPMRELIHTLDGPNMGPAPGAWQIEAHPRTLFADMDLSIQVPHTEEVRICHTCRGRGDIICSFCHGHGRTTCHSCHGSGRRTVHKTDSNGQSRTETEHCGFCHHGHRDCHTCNSTGYVRCNTCDGYRNLIHFLRLDINWRNKRQRAVIDAEDNQLDVSERTRLTSSEAVRNAQGPLVYAEENVVLPLNDGISTIRVNPGVTASVNRLLEAAQDPSQLQHRQRVTIRGLPMYKVSYLDKGQQFNFWVIGTNRTVHAPNLPKDIIRLVIASLLALILIGLIVGGIGAVVYFVL